MIHMVNNQASRDVVLLPMMTSLKRFLVLNSRHRPAQVYLSQLHRAINSLLSNPRVLLNHKLLLPVNLNKVTLFPIITTHITIQANYMVLHTDRDTGSTNTQTDSSHLSSLCSSLQIQQVHPLRMQRVQVLFSPIQFLMPPASTLSNMLLLRMTTAMVIMDSLDINIARV